MSALARPVRVLRLGRVAHFRLQVRRVQLVMYDTSRVYDSETEST